MTTETSQTVFPTLRYDDAHKAIRFLTEAFGFTENAIHEGPDDTIAHAQLAWGNGIVMLSSAGSDGSVFDLRPVCVYVVVDDIDEHHRRAVAAGAEIVMPPTDQDYGSRDYAVRDFEGNIWAFGTYRPEPVGK